MVDMQLTLCRSFQTETALMYDAVHVFARALHRFNQKLTVRPLNCQTEDSWAEGNSLVNYIRLVSSTGSIASVACWACRTSGSCSRGQLMEEWKDWIAVAIGCRLFQRCRYINLNKNSRAWW